MSLINMQLHERSTEMKQSVSMHKNKKKKEVNMMIVRTLVVVLSFVFCLSAFAANDEKPALALKMSVEKKFLVKEEDGKTRVEWRPLESSNPGDVLRYTITYKNEGKAEAHRPNIVDPVPAGTTYIGNTAGGKEAEVTFSLEGKKFQTAPALTYKVKQPDGTEKEFVATPEMYTHIKWTLTQPVPPGGTGSVEFQVRVK